MINQGNGQESVDALKAQCQLHNLGIYVGRLEKDVEMQRGEGIKKEQTIQKVYEHKKDASLLNDSRRSFYDELIDKGHNAIKELRNLQPHEVERFLEEREKAWRDNKIDDPDSPDWNSMGEYPPMMLMLAFMPAGPDGLYEEEMTRLAQEMTHLETKYPDIAKQRWNLYRKLGAITLNELIKHDKFNDTMFTIRNGIHRLDQSNTETGREMKETILDTIRNNLIGEDKNLKEKTKTLLAKDEPLTQMVLDQNGPRAAKKLKIKLEDRKVPPAIVLYETRWRSGPMKKVPKHVWQEIIKYS
jgi:hypothetical protein